MEAYPPSRRATDGGSPTSPFSTGSSGGGNSAFFGSDPSGLTGPPGAADDLAFEFSGANIWAPFVNGSKQQPGAGNGGGGGSSVAAAPSSGGPQASHPQPLRRNSSGLSGGGVMTPRLSPTLPVAVGGSASDAAGLLDHPLARRAQSDPLSTLAWLQTGGVGISSFGGGGGGSSSSSGSSSSTGYSSCSASSLPGGSPTDSEGGGSGVGLPVAGMLSRLKGAGGVGAAGLVMAAGAVGVGMGVSGRDCCVCFESEVTAALVPCGHNLFCMDCAGQICQSQEPECPKCHTPATQCIRIFS